MDNRQLPRFRLEFYPTNPKRPAAIWDYDSRDEEGWYRLVIDFSAGKATMAEAEAICSALNKANPDAAP